MIMKNCYHNWNLDLNERLGLIKKMITQMVICQIILTSKKYYKMIAIDLSKQKALDVDPKAIQQINFIENINQTGNTTIVFHY